MKQYTSEYLCPRFCYYHLIRYWPNQEIIAVFGKKVATVEATFSDAP